ncbi:MAG: flagellar export protein FliJ [Lachnospiraceae bacterium]|nr:flagellar export protein FliJ [Lachnospiraceae bacterium]
MAKFVFSLQSILNIKLKMETQAKQAFAAAKNRLDEEEQRLEELYQRKNSYEERAKELLQGTLRIRDIEDNKNAILMMDAYIADQLRRVEAARERLEYEREQMTEAVKERKTYETLREQAFEEFLQDENKAESKAVDELVSYTYGQRMAETV